MPQGSDAIQTKFSFPGFQTKCTLKPISTICIHLLKRTVLYKKVKPVKDMFPNKTQKSKFTSKGQSSYWLLSRHLLTQFPKC